jgi:hypothetical protein
MTALEFPKKGGEKESALKGQQGHLIHSNQNDQQHQRKGEEEL